MGNFVCFLVRFFFISFNLGTNAKLKCTIIYISSIFRFKIRFDPLCKEKIKKPSLIMLVFW